MRDPIQRHCSLQLLKVLTTIGLFLDLNDYLTHQYHNNWNKDDNWDWDKEIVLITGGSSGIGASVAQMLLSRNPKTRIVIIDCVPLTFTPAPSSSVQFYNCDLSRSSEIRSTCAKIRNEVGDPTIVFNNAGLSRGKSVLEGAYEDVEVTFKVNLIAPFLILKEFLPAMVKSNHGHIIATSSMSAIVTPAGLADYGATKAGLQNLHEALALELASKYNATKIRTSLVTISFTETPMFKGRTNQSPFLTPLLKVDTVGEAIVNILYSGCGKNIYLPGIMRYISCVRGFPSWMVRFLGEETGRLQVDYVGRQEIDTATGGLKSE
ncbi:NAD(P)-binding protein [Periconia macrospinosa]|uniref:NAD(P)-binding protein n=1 Tax=Periconia macrospinosa TaxID=97972 RepID=A0A2V1D263_9PLEO|nr:NAD(P)-binding protein [Periconia macrospinosa]